MDNYNTVDLGKNSSDERQIFLEKIFPEVRNNKYIYEQAVEELNAKRLLVSAKSGAKLAGVGLHVLDLHKSVVSLSDTGKQFLNYIKLSKETY